MGTPGSRQMNPVRISPGGLWRCLDRVRDPFLFRDLGKHLEHRVVRGRTSTQHRSTTQGVFAQLLLIDIGYVGAEGDIDNQRNVRIERIRTCTRPTPLVSDLLLHRGDRAGTRLQSSNVISQQADRFKHHKSADPVINCPTRDQITSEPNHALGDHHRITDADPERVHGVAVISTDIHP